MPSLSVEMWAALTSGLLALYFFVKAKIAAARADSLANALEKSLNRETNQTIDEYVKVLNLKSKAAKEAYEKEKQDAAKFVGPKPGNS